MLKSVLFVSKATFVNRIKATPNMVVISIGSDDDDPPRLNRGFAGAIRLCFEDHSEETAGLPVGILPDLHPRHAAGVRIYANNYELCDWNDARRIVTQLDHYAVKEGEFELVVHCQAGISRSAAVAQFAADRYCAVIENANPDTSGANPRLLRLLNRYADGLEPRIFDIPDLSGYVRKAERTSTVMGIF